MEINLSNVIKINLNKDSDWSRIADIKRISGKVLFQFKLDGYSAVWLEKISGNHRLIAYTKDGYNYMADKFSHNTSNSTKDYIFKMSSFPVPTNSEYKRFLNENSDKIFKDYPDKSKKVNKRTSRKTKASKPKLNQRKSTKKAKPKKKELEILSIDAILDKINKKGIASLTVNEKKFLDEESKKI